MWNTIYLRQPPISTESYSRKSLNKQKLRSVHSQLFDCHQVCDKQSELLSELEILTKLYYKFKNQWRREKCLRNVKQIQACLKRWIAIKLNDNLHQLLDLVPASLRKNKDDPDIRLPSASMVEYTLLRLLGASKLLKKIAEICTTAFQNVTAQLSAGLFVQSMTIVAAAVSRIWILVRFMQNEFCKCYTVLHTWLPELKPPTVSIITMEEPLPNDIIAWLEPEIASSNRMSTDCTVETQIPQETSNVSEKEINEISLNQTDTSEYNADNDSSTLLYPNDDKDDEVGQVLDRSEFEKLFQAKTSNISTESDKNRNSDKLIISNAELSSSALKKMKKFLKSVDVLPSDEDSADSPPLKKRKFVRLSVEEYRKWSLEALSCSSVDSLRQFLTKLNRSHPDFDFRGMTKCVAQLKDMEPSRRKLGKDVDVRRKRNKKIMGEMKKIVKAMLKLNYQKSLKGKKDRKLNIIV